MKDMVNKKSRITVTYKSTGDVEYDRFFPRESKEIVDKTDTMSCADI